MTSSISERAARLRDALSDRVGGDERLTTLVVVAAAVVAWSDAPGYGVITGAALAAGAGFVGLVVLASRHKNSQRDDVEDLKTRYADGEISLSEFERGVGFVLDDDMTRLREHLESVNGIGPATSASVALEFGSLYRLRRASVGDVEQIYGVGPSTAAAIVEHVDDVDDGSDTLDDAVAREQTPSVATDGGSDE